MFLRSLFASKPSSVLLRPLLLCMGMLDELVTGFLFIGLPLIHTQLHIDYAQLGLLFSMGELCSVILDPLINLFSDCISKRWLIVGGLFLFALSFIVIGSTDNFILLILAFVVLYPANTAAIELAQAALIDFNPATSAYTMARWTLLSNVGDFIAPLFVPFVVTLNKGWSLLCWLGALICIGVALVIALLPFPAPAHDEVEEEENELSIWQGLRAALRDPLLLRWAALTLIPTMMDEIFISFATLYLHDVLHANESAIALILGIHMIGGMLGLVVLERFLLPRNLKPAHLLTGMALLALVGMVLFLLLPNLWLAGCALFIIGLSVSSWYPLAKAQAYDRMPGRTGIVRAVIGLGASGEIVLPGVVGLISQRFGVLAGLAFLGLAPVLILILTLPSLRQSKK